MIEIKTIMNVLNSKTLISLAAVIVSVLFAVSSSNSYADDWKIFPGSICKSKRTSADITIYGGASIINIGIEQPQDPDDPNPTRTEPAAVVCPLVRDRALKRWKSISVRVADNSSTDSVRCTATNYQLNGLESQSVTKSTGNDFIGVKSLLFPRLPKSPDGLSGPFQIFCTLPANPRTASCSRNPASALRVGCSAIHSIKLVEE